MLMETEQQIGKEIPQTESKTCLSARDSIAVIPDSAFPQIALFAGDERCGPIDRYVTMPDGTPHTQAEFLFAYATLQNRVATRARDLLTTIPSMPDLLALRGELQKPITANTIPDGDPEPDPISKLPQINLRIQQKIMEFAGDPSDETETLITMFATNLAIMAFKEESADAKILSTINRPGNELQVHSDMMQSARSFAETAEAARLYPTAKTDQERAFLIVLDCKLKRGGGMVPKLQILTDADNTLGANADNQLLKPGKQIGFLLDHIDKIVLLPIRQRLSIIDEPQLTPEFASVRAQILHAAGQVTPLFPDAIETLKLATKNHVPTTVLSANLNEVVQSIVSLISPESNVEIVGLAPDSSAGQHKPRRVIEAVLNNPYSVPLFVDDGDHETIDAITSGGIAPNIPIGNIRLQDVAFLFSRDPDPDGKIYPLQQTLEQYHIPYTPNVYQKNMQDGSVTGYQGVQRFVELYLEWRDTRLAENWQMPDHSRTLVPPGKILPPPIIEKHLVIGKGKDNKKWNAWTGTAGIARIGSTTIALVKGTNNPPEGEKAKHNHYLALLGDDGINATGLYDDPLLFPRNNEIGLFPHGLEDARITRVDERWVIVSNANNKNLRDKTLFEWKEKRLDGCYIYAHTTTDPRDPHSYIPIGKIGPDFFLKNAMLYPEVVDIGGKPHYLLYIRNLPSIQLIPIPVKDFWAIADDDELRHRFWDQSLQPDYLAKFTILQPLFPWEAKGHPQWPKGQIAGGAPPIPVEYKDPYTGATVKAWLCTHNSPTGFDPKGNTNDRVIGVSLADRDDPWKVLARPPRPILTPTQPDEVNGRYPYIVFTIGAAISADGDELRIYYTGGDQVLKVGKCNLGELLRWMTQYDAYGQLRSE